MTEEQKQPENETPAPAPRVSVDFKPGRWGKVFHLFDGTGREIVLDQKDAAALARQVLKVAGEK